MSEPRFQFQLEVFFGALLFVVCEIILEVHFPGTDVFLFKEAGINLATKGKFVASFLPHMMFGDERPFAYYPPLYPFAFGVWSWLVGVGLKQSLAFESLLTLARTLLMVRLIIPEIPEEFFKRGNRFMRLLFGLFFTLLTLVTTDRDRPDELALIWGLLLCLTLTSTKPQGVKILLGSFFLACVGATSPACGVLFALSVVLWSLSEKRSLRVLVRIAMGSMIFWSLFIMPILIHDLASGVRFSKQAGISSFPYLRHLQDPWTFKSFCGAWISDLKLFWGSGSQYLLAALGAFGIGTAFLVCRRFKINSMDPLFVIAPMSYLLLVPLVWTLQPYYVWFASILLMIGVFRMAFRNNRRTQAATLALYFAFLTPLWFWESKCVLNALETPESERSQQIQKAVLSAVEPEAKLAVTHDQYFTFRSRREVVNVDYWMQEANRFDYLYITDLPDSRRRISRSRQLLSEKDLPCFELVKDFSTYTPIHVLGYKTQHFVRGNGGSLFRNICKEPRQTS